MNIKIESAPAATAEGATAVFTVELDKVYSSIVTVQASTSSGTATAGTDFANSTMTITFSPGETSKTFKKIF